MSETILVNTLTSENSKMATTLYNRIGSELWPGYNSDSISDKLICRNLLGVCNGWAHNLPSVKELGNIQAIPIAFCPPPSLKGRSGTIVFVSVKCSFIRPFIRSFVWHTLVSGLAFLNQTTYDVAFWHNDSSYQDLAWDCLSASVTYIWLGYNLFSVIGIGFLTFIPEPNHIGCCFLAQ